MAQSLRQIRTRIRSVENIEKITHAMEMVSSSKLRMLQKQLSVTREYFLHVKRILNNVLAGSDSAQHQLVMPKKTKKNILLCVVTSDTGLCGSYNTGIIHKAEEFMRENSAYKVSLFIIGRKGSDHFKKANLTIAGFYTGLFGKFTDKLIDKIVGDLSGIFLSGKADEVYVAYADYESASKVKPVIEKLLNIEVEKKESLNLLTEPAAENMLEELIPLYLNSRIRTILLSSFTAENSIRVMSMHEATDNAQELSDALVMLRNKMRQAKITGELIEVISSADAMKG